MLFVILYFLIDSISVHIFTQYLLKMLLTHIAVFSEHVVSKHLLQRSIFLFTIPIQVRIISFCSQLLLAYLFIFFNLFSYFLIHTLRFYSSTIKSYNCITARTRRITLFLYKVVFKGETSAHPIKPLTVQYYGIAVFVSLSAL